MTTPEVQPDNWSAEQPLTRSAVSRPKGYLMAGLRGALGGGAGGFVAAECMEHVSDSEVSIAVGTLGAAFGVGVACVIAEWRRVHDNA